MRSVAVIGAGVSGLAALKSLLEEGLDAVAYEASKEIGGLWYYRESPEGHPCVMNCTVMNSSKEMSSFSDFPPSMSSPLFLPHTCELEYLKQYAKHFRLGDHIRLGHRVEAIRPTMDHERTGRWEVTVLDLESGERRVSPFDAVVVCSGKHSIPRIPQFPGLDTFKGRVVHSSEYRTSDKFKGKRVLVVGIGNSASDAAVELTGVADKVYLSTRTGAWLFGRLGKGGYPGDVMMFTRLKLFLQHYVLPYNWVCNYVEGLLSLRMDHDLYKLKPAHRALSHYPTITDDLPMKLASGQVLLRRDVDLFYENAVRFRGDHPETVKIDDVIMATGYEETFPFLDEQYWPLRDGLLDIFMNTFPTKAVHPTLSFVGMSYALGPQLPAIELQTRWIARVYSQKCQLPSSNEMIRHVENQRRIFKQRFGANSLLNGMVDWLPFMDQIAEYIGAKPNIWRMAFQDPQLCWRLIFGPALPYAYRLEGPHAWKGARDAIMRMFDRIRGNLSEQSEEIKKNV